MTITTEPYALGGDVSNNGEGAVLATAPYRVVVEITGDCPILFHKYDVEYVRAKEAADKNSDIKKKDDPQVYVWRDEDGVICLPGHYFVGAMTDSKNGAAKYKPDPRSKRKAALDLFKAGVTPLTHLAPITRADGQIANHWDYIDVRGVGMQKGNKVPRERPAFATGWKAEHVLMVTTPQYISPVLLREVLTKGGQLTGVGDFRPTFGRFSITRFEMLTD